MRDDIAPLERELEAASVEPIDPVRRVDALVALAWELRGHSGERAYQLSSEARELARQHGYTLGQARAARTMGMSIRSPELVSEVYEYAQEALRLFDEVGDAEGRAGARDFLSSLHEWTGDLAGALELALDALSIAREVNNPIRIGYALSNVGGILAACDELDAGVERLEEALALFKNANNREGVAAILSRLMRVMQEAGENDRAWEYALAVQSLAGGDNDEFLKHESFRAMARIEEARGNIDEAEKLCRASLESLENPAIRELVGAEVAVTQGRLLIKKGQLAEAEAILKNSLEKTRDEPLGIVAHTTCHEILAEAYETQGDLESCVFHLKAAKALREGISKKDSRHKLTQLEVRTKMEEAKRDAQLQKLRYVELHSMQSKQVETEKMAVLGKLAAGTAHEMNTPLGVLRSNAKLTASATERLLALVEPHLNETGKARADKLFVVLHSTQETNEKAIERIAAIAQSFKRFTQLDQAERRAFKLREGLDSAIALLQPTISKSIQLETQLNEVPEVQAWPRELNHAFLTVLQNAVQAIDGEGTVRIQTSSTDKDVVATIEDTGRGMSEQQVAHLFDVAWSVDGKRTKMRLGLSAAYATMRKHGGSIEASSQLGEGTTITFRFPRTGSK